MANSCHASTCDQPDMPAANDRDSHLLCLQRPWAIVSGFCITVGFGKGFSCGSCQNRRTPIGQVLSALGSAYPAREAGHGSRPSEWGLASVQINAHGITQELCLVNYFARASALGVGPNPAWPGSRNLRRTKAPTIKLKPRRTKRLGSERPSKSRRAVCTT
jgi:hypothetical protein